VLAQVGDQERNGRVADHAGHHRRHHEVEPGRVAREQLVAFLVELVQAGAEDGRQRQQEGEPGGRLARQAGEQPAGDRHAGARGAGDQRQGLGEADQQRLAPGQPLQIGLGFPAGGPPLRQEHHQGQDDGGPGDNVERAERPLDVLLEQQAEEDDGHGADGDHPGQPGVAGV
jgi:hypothetical protein